MSRLFDIEKFCSAGALSGITMRRFGEALITWVAMQDRPDVTVAEAAATWNITPAIVLLALDETYWAYAVPPQCDDPGKQIIELEGE